MMIDARGKGCPIPVMMTEEALSKIGEGIIDALVDKEESALNVAGYAEQKGMFVETTREGRDWKVKIAKGYTCKPNAEPIAAGAEPQAKKTLLLSHGTYCLDWLSQPASASGFNPVGQSVKSFLSANINHPPALISGFNSEVRL